MRLAKLLIVICCWFPMNALAQYDDGSGGGDVVTAVTGPELIVSVGSMWMVLVAETPLASDGNCYSSNFGYGGSDNAVQLGLTNSAYTYYSWAGYEALTRNGDQCLLVKFFSRPPNGVGDVWAHAYFAGPYNMWYSYHVMKSAGTW